MALVTGLVFGLLVSFFLLLTAVPPALGDRTELSSAELASGISSVAIYLVLIAFAIPVWDSASRWRWLGVYAVCIFATIALSGGAGGFVVYAPCLLVTLALLLTPVRRSRAAPGDGHRGHDSS